MAAPRPLPDAAANENQSTDPRGVSNGAAPATSQDLTLVNLSQGDNVDDEFAFLRELLAAEPNGVVPADFSFTGYLEDDSAPGFPAADNTFHAFAATDNTIHGFAATDNAFLGFGTTNNAVHGFAATDNTFLGFGITNSALHGFTATDTIHGFAATDHMTQGLATTDSLSQGFAAMGATNPLAGFESFFDLEGASQPLGVGMIDNMALNGVGSQFGASDSMFPAVSDGNLWQNDPTVFPPGFESASNVAASTPIRFNPYQVEGLEGDLPDLPELPDLEALAREFVRGAAVDLPTLGADESGAQTSQTSQNNSLPAQNMLPPLRPKPSEFKFINKMNNDFAPAQTIKTTNTMDKNTLDHLSSGIHAPTNTPVPGGVGPGVESAERVLTAVPATDSGVAHTTMDAPVLLANVPGADAPATGDHAVDAIPAGPAANDGEDKGKKPAARKRKADDADNTETGSGNDDKKAPPTRKRSKNNRGYGPRVDTSQPGTASAIGPFMTKGGNRTQDQGALQQSNEDPDAPKWSRRMPSLLDCTDPYMCPGPNLNCFHAFQNTNGYFLHVDNVHGVSRSKMNKPEFRHLKEIFEPHPESWWLARGQDTTYQGTDRKQINARRRMAAGMRSNDPNYVEEVYVRTPAVRSAANAAASAAANKKTTKK